MKLTKSLTSLWLLVAVAVLVMAPEGETRRVGRGVCPDTSGIITICLFTEENCLSDAECEPLERCCPYGCGSRCMRPVYG